MSHVVSASGFPGKVCSVSCGLRFPERPVSPLAVTRPHTLICQEP
ncbi:hypothetical protein BMS3Bbin02_00734 [bacterium BMS3Bbin02]|nr:hypothetical protein BMS3Bbin02_00734 [bacterium BMS3Bbin02]